MNAGRAASRVRERLDAERGHRVEHLPIDVAPAPVLAGLEAADDRMMRRVEVFCGVLVRRIVTAADVAAGQAEAQMNPVCADLQALLTAVGRARLVRIDLV